MGRASILPFLNEARQQPATMAPSDAPQDLESAVKRADAAQPNGRKSADARATPADDGAAGRRGEHLPAQGRAFIEAMEKRIPDGIQRKYGTAVIWLRGPEPTRAWKIRPLLPRVQHLPLRLVDKLLPRQWQRAIALLVFYVCWIATFGAVMHESSAVDEVDGQGSPYLVGCGASFWYGSSTVPLSCAKSC